MSLAFEFGSRSLDITIAIRSRSSVYNTAL